jgi:hypothetical protein
VFHLFLLGQVKKSEKIRNFLPPPDSAIRSARILAP